MGNNSATTNVQVNDRANQRNAVAAGFLGWTLDAFDFFVLTFVLAAVARDLGVSIAQVAATITGSLAMRPVGALVFGLMADRYGRRWPLMLDIIFYSVVEVLSGLSPNFKVFFVMRLLYGIGMGGNWGVGASLVMESVSPKWRGVASGLLQEGYALGNILAAVVYYLVFPHWGWRAMFFVGGLPALLSLFIFVKVKEPEAWRESRTDWGTYGRVIARHGKLFFYIVLLTTVMNCISHGTQDLYPTLLQQQRHFSPQTTALIVMISMVGAIAGGLVFGHYSDRAGRRRAMLTAVILAILMIPAWVLSSTIALIVPAVFLMQFMVQGAWGVIPVHLNELSPGELRGFFPGFAYQLGVLFASSITLIEAILAKHLTYAQSLGLLAGLVLLIGVPVIGLGPEAKGVAFGKAEGGKQ
ncbi:MAG: MFS transporter [Terriglobia bacterium]|jgi:SHS family lactate transporter-like MFS transporter